MHFLGKVLKRLLRSIFSIIIFLLLIGLAKARWNIGTYISFLNNNDWSAFSWSQPTTWVDPFWSNNQVSGDIADILDYSMDAELSGLDVYDPAFEQDLNTITDGSGLTKEDYGGFVTSGQTASDTPSSPETTSKSELLNLIKQRELTK